MKKIIIPLILFLFIIGVVFAIDILLEPYSDTFTTQSELGKSLQEIRDELNLKSCYVQQNWESKDCDYLYYCYAILPSTSDSISDALQRECIDVTEDDGILEIKEFIPPKGVLYYVVTFITKTKYLYEGNDWSADATIPTDYINAHAIRSVCPEGQMLDFDENAGEYRCYLAKRACLDTMRTGLCTNTYTLWVLDRDMNGELTDAELKDGKNYCADRPTPSNPDGDGICDRVADLGCPDSNFNNLCDEWDLAVEYGCWDDKLSPNSKICDTLDVVGCFRDYDPVCVGGRGGITYPNACFAEGQGHTDYTQGACEPPITQCYVAEDCPDLDVCLGGSITGISKLCLNYMCSYSGACGNLACDKDSDCEGMNMPCVGVFPSCKRGVCTISGKCLTQPEPQKINIWTLIANIWNTIWAFIRNLF